MVERERERERDTGPKQRARQQRVERVEEDGDRWREKVSQSVFSEREIGKIKM